MTKNTGLTGFIWDLKKPSKDGYVACVVITPNRRDAKRGVDTAMKLNRDIGRKMAIDMAAKLLKSCKAPTGLLSQIQSFRESK